MKSNGKQILLNEPHNYERKNHCSNIHTQEFVFVSSERTMPLGHTT